MFDLNDIKELEKIAKRLKIETEVLLAITEVESNGVVSATVNGEKKPLIRWEGHYFDKLIPNELRDKARKQKLASPKMGGIPNPKSQTGRYQILEKAKLLDVEAAISSCSWGVGQVMGAHWKKLGFSSAEELETVATSGLTGQVELMARYIQKFGLVDECQRKDFAGFARGYNGPAYKRFKYDTKMQAAYNRYKKNVSVDASDTDLIKMGMKGSKVRELQRLLVRAGFPVNIDGDFGPTTKTAVQNFQRSHKLKADGIVGPKTWKFLTEFKVAPDEDLSSQAFMDKEGSKTAVGTAGGGVVTGGVATQLQDVASQIGFTGNQYIDLAVNGLMVIAGILTLVGLVYMGYCWLKED